MRILRRLVFYACAAAYLVVCPLLILHALGYSVRPGAEPGVGKTGLLALDSLPSGASVYLEGRRYAHPTPSVLSGLWPGQYRVKLVAKRHRPWSRWITIEAEKATVLDKVLLVPDQPVVRRLAPGPFQTLAGIPESTLLVLTQGQAAGQAMVYDWKAGELRPLVTQPEWEHGRLVSLKISRGPRVLLRVHAASGARMMWIEADRTPVQGVDVTSLFPEEPDWAGWDARHPSQLFAQWGRAVNRIDVEDDAIHPAILRDVRGLDVSGQSLYALGEDDVLRHHDRDGKPVHAVSDDPASRTLFAAAPGPCRVDVFAKDLVAVLGPQGQLWLSRIPDRWIATKIRGVAYDLPRDRLLIWQKDRAGIVELAQDRFFIRWLMKGGDIHQAFWVHDGSHVLLHDGDTVLLLNVQTPDTAVPEPIIQVRPGSAIAYHEDAGGVLYLDPRDGGLWYFNIVPTKNVAERLS